jgi:hypothetical protein
MPQLEKGGKFVFGWSRVRDDGSLTLPDEAVQEYGLAEVNRIFLMSGSKTSGGFGITTKAFLEKSPISGILSDNLDLAGFKKEEGKVAPFKNRSICWVQIYSGGRIALSQEAMKVFGINTGEFLLSIRSSNIAIGMAEKGPLIKIAKTHPEIKVFE